MGRIEGPGQGPIFKGEAEGPSPLKETQKPFNLKVTSKQKEILQNLVKEMVNLSNQLSTNPQNSNSLKLKFLDNSEHFWEKIGEGGIINSKDRDYFHEINTLLTKHLEISEKISRATPDIEELKKSRQDIENRLELLLK